MIMQRSIKRFAYQIVSKDDGPYLFIYLKSDAWKIGRDLPVPGAWVRINLMQPMDHSLRDMLVERYYTLLVQPWERMY